MFNTITDNLNFTSFNVKYMKFMNFKFWLPWDVQIVNSNEFSTSA